MNKVEVQNKMKCGNIHSDGFCSTKTGAEVLIEPTDYRSDPPVTRVRVTGEDSKVAKAVGILEEILAWAAAHPREEAGTTFIIFKLLQYQSL